MQLVCRIDDYSGNVVNFSHSISSALSALLFTPLAYAIWFAIDGPYDGALVEIARSVPGWRGLGREVVAQGHWVIEDGYIKKVRRVRWFEICWS